MTALRLAVRLAFMLGTAAAVGESFTCQEDSGDPRNTCYLTMICLDSAQSMSSTKCCNSERCLTADPTFNDWSKSDMVCDQSLLDMLQPMSCLNNQLIMMAMESSKEPDQAGTTMLVAAGIGGASFTCPSQGEQPPGMKCTLTTTCPSLAKSKMTTACTYNGIKMDPITAYQDIPNPLHCDQSYMDMMKPMMCANNELTMMTMEALKGHDQAGATKLVAAGFTCPMQGEQPQGMKCTVTTTCLSLAKSKMTTTCTYNGIEMDPITNYQDMPNPLHCDQSYMDMMKPMMCANNELMMMAMEGFKEPNQAWTTLLVVAGSAGASGALMMLALLRAWRFTARGPVLLG